MRHSQRLIAAGVLFAVCSALAGCGGGVSSFDPTDMLDFLDTKKKLPGDRKPVFPEGVPGLEQGVPKDLYRGAAEERARQEQLQQQQQAVVAPAEPKTQPSKAKAKVKRASGPASAPAQQDVAPVDDDDAAPPPPKPVKRAQRTGPSAQTDQQRTPAQTQSQSSSSSFPAPLPSGSFSR